VFDRLGQRQAFKLDPVAGQDGQLVPADGRHAEAALVGARDQALGRQAAQGLAQRAGTHAVALGHRAHAQLAAGLQLAVGDVGAQTLIDRAGASGRGYAVNGSNGNGGFARHKCQFDLINRLIEV
jgi:hypothetical protein